MPAAFGEHNSVRIQPKALKDAESVTQEQMDVVITVLVPESFIFQELQENLHGGLRVVGLERR